MWQFLFYKVCTGQIIVVNYACKTQVKVTLAGWVQNQKDGGMTHRLTGSLRHNAIGFNQDIHAELCDCANELGREFECKLVVSYLKEAIKTNTFQPETLKF